MANKIDVDKGVRRTLIARSLIVREREREIAFDDREQHRGGRGEKKGLLHPSHGVSPHSHTYGSMG